MKINEVVYVTHEADILYTHLLEHSSFVDMFFIKVFAEDWSGRPNPFFDNLGQLSEVASSFSSVLLTVPTQELYTPIPQNFDSEDHMKYFRLMQRNRENSKSWKWDEIRADCDYVLSTDVDEIISETGFHEGVEPLLHNRENEFLSVKLHEHNQWVNYRTCVRDLYRFYRSDIPEYTQYYKGRKRCATENPVGWHLTNCFPSAIELYWKLVFASALPDFKGNPPTLIEVEDKIRNGEIVHTAKSTKEATILSILNASEWAPEYVATHPHRFMWHEGGVL